MLKMYQLFRKLKCNAFIRRGYFKALASRKYTTVYQHDTHKLLSLSALEDNYMYVLINVLTRSAIAIDPVEPVKIFAALEKENAKLQTILTTHHHFDHCGGNLSIAEEIPGIPIYGGDERIEGLTHKVSDEDVLEFDSFSVRCLFTPCHTSGHMCYYVTGKDGSPICFCGDTLFVAGCGRFFEGTASHMLTSLDKLSKLPTKTLVCCGHEYTVGNLNFAVHVEPSNLAAKSKLAWSLQKRNNDEPTVPSTIGEEKSYNPFMRVKEAEVQRFTGFSEPTEVMAELRKRKDVFKMI